jgi:hypothetical protein
MGSVQTAIVHVGIHKTGTSSIQAFLHANRVRLRDAGLEFYTGRFQPSNHVEVHAAAMRFDRLSPFKARRRVVVDEAFRAETTQRVQHFVRQSTAPRVLFSAEGLSYLRHTDEFERLKAMMPTEIQVIMYLRERAAFLESYRAEIAKLPISPVASSGGSFADVSDGTWLVDYEDRVERFRQAFGQEKVIVLDYDREMHDSGNVIPSFLRAIGAAHLFDPTDWSGLFLRRRASAS